MVATYSDFITSIDVVIEALFLLATDNGWTIDRHDTNSRLHISKSGYHFDIYKVSSTVMGIAACQGYDSGATYSAQPGTSPYKTSTIYDYAGPDKSGYMPRFRVCASGNSMFIFPGVIDGSSYYIRTRGMAFGVIEDADKIGNWTGGQYVFGAFVGNNSSDFWLFDNSNTSQSTALAVYVNGEWAPGANLGQPVGRFSTLSHIRGKMPNVFNAGVLPTKCPLFAANISNSGLYHPLGFVSGMRLVRGADVYLDGDTFNIGADTYVACGAYQGCESDNNVQWAVKIS